MAEQVAADISLLKPKVRRLAEELCVASEKAGVPIQIVRGFRTHEEQDVLYARGRTASGPIVTNAKGGESFHNYGVAFDISPVEFTDEADKLRKRMLIGPIGESLGLEWGGRWTEFFDPPHFQFTAGYSIADFKKGIIDWEKFV